MRPKQALPTSTPLSNTLKKIQQKYWTKPRVKYEAGLLGARLRFWKESFYSRK
jgi:hypothetical protein